MATIRDYITGTHNLYSRYQKEWRLSYNSYIGSTEYKRAKYLKAYQVDFEQPSETIKTYDVGSDGRIVQEFHTKLTPVASAREADAGAEAYEGTFYGEKLENTPLYPYVRLYVSAYNALLFRNPPHREVYEEDSVVYPLAEAFEYDTDGEGNGINEFMSQVDVFTSVFGICWVSCVKPEALEYALWAAHTPLEVTNWRYTYGTDGKLKLVDIVINIANDEAVSIFRRFTPEVIETYWVPKRQEKLEIDVENLFETDGMYYTTSPNELGYIPVIPIYQGQKLYNGVGMTPMFDISQIQRSVYGDTAEIYSAITYGAHPVNLVDQETARMNEGKLGAEPGTVVTVPANNIPGQGGNYVFEFRSPPLDSIEAIRNIIADKISRMNEIAMISSDDIMKSANSGVQLELYNDKLEAFIKRKATSMENAEQQLWRIWYDWLDQEPPESLSISYSKVYSKRGIEQEIAEITALVEVYDQFINLFGGPQSVQETSTDFSTTSTEVQTTGSQAVGQEPADTEDIRQIRESLKARFTAVLMKSYSENGK